MPYIIKTDPFSIERFPGDNVPISARPFYGGDTIDVGEEAFVWFSEKSGGCGLDWLARVTSVSQGERAFLDVSLSLVNRRATGSLGKHDLRPYRNENDGTPTSELARKLYFHAHNKIAAISRGTADYLRGFFDP